MPFRKTFLIGIALLLEAAIAQPAQASIIISGTRIVYDAKQSETTVKLSNNGSTPALAQSWIDDGDAAATPATLEVPFTLTPPVARIDPGKAQTLRILYTGEPLPQDRETVFWLNMLEVPPKPSGDDADGNRLQMALRTRIKLFFRPAGLEGRADEAPPRITWRLVRQGDRAALEGRNPTRYHVSYAQLELAAGEQVARNIDGGMIAPGAATVFPLSGDIASGARATVRYQSINDYGAPVSGEAALDAPDATASSAR